MELTWFLQFFINGFSKNCFKITKKPLRTRSKQQISHIIYISKVSISQGIQPKYILQRAKVGCVFKMVGVSLLSYAKFGPNDHLEDGSHFTLLQSLYITAPGNRGAVSSYSQYNNFVKYSPVIIWWSIWCSATWITASWTI